MDGSWWRVVTKMWSIGEREWQTTSVFLPQEPHEQYEKNKKIWCWKMNPLGRNVSNMLLGKSGEIAPRRGLGQNRNDAQLWICLVVKVWCCKQQHRTGTWNVRSMNQGKLDVVMQEMARLNVDILGISELKWMRTGEFNSDDHYIY